MTYLIEAKKLQDFFGSIVLDEYTIFTELNGWEVHATATGGTIYQSIKLSRDAFEKYEDGDNIGIINPTLLMKMISGLEGVLTIETEGGVLDISSILRTVRIPLGVVDREETAIGEIPYEQESITIQWEVLSRAGKNIETVGARAIVFEAKGNELRIITSSTKGEMVETIPIPERNFTNQIAGILKTVLPHLREDVITIQTQNGLPFTFSYQREGITNQMVVAHLIE